MITVQLNRADFEYDIHSLVKAFFPSEDVSVGVEKKETEEEISFHIVISYLEDSIEILLYVNAQKERAVQGRPMHALYKADLKEHAKTECQEGMSSDAKEMEKPVQRRIAAVDFSDRKETKNRLKKALYQTLHEYTKKPLPWGTLTGIRPTKIPMAFLDEGKDDAFIRNYMKETYFASDEKINLSLEVAKRERSLLRKLDYENGYSLYIGIPFCPGSCLYCSFTSYPIGVWEKRTDEYLNALEQEIEFTAERFKEKRLNTIYVGGGTPTALNPGQLGRLIGKIKSSFDLSCCLEFTVEAGRPDSITREKLETLREAGISRISVNPQTMKEETLKIIGRRHTVSDTVESFNLARELGFDNINMDLIVGLPGETLSDVKSTMERIVSLDPDNLTVHSLALKRAARLKMNWEAYQHMTFENTNETIALTAEYAKRMDMTPYYLYRQKNMAGNFENVGYAKAGKAGIYNILIMEEVQDIAACGAGSISKRVYPDGRIERCENVKDVAQYMERIDEMIERKSKLFEEEKECH